MRSEKDDGRGEKTEKSRGRGLKFRKFSIRSESFPIFEDPLDPSIPALYRVTGFFGRKGNPRFYPDPFENFERMIPRAKESFIYVYSCI